LRLCPISFIIAARRGFSNKPENDRRAIVLSGV
jgi:hypothetical protein